MEEVVKGRETSISVKESGRRCKGRVIGRDRDGVASCERKEEAWGKSTLEVHMMFKLRKRGKERVKTVSAHDNRWKRREKNKECQ